eukprot:PhF_6_TR44269/c0_g1_i3/m.68189
MLSIVAFLVIQTLFVVNGQDTTTQAKETTIPTTVCDSIRTQWLPMANALAEASPEYTLLQLSGDIAHDLEAHLHEKDLLHHQGYDCEDAREVMMLESFEKYMATFSTLAEGKVVPGYSGDMVEARLVEMATTLSREGLISEDGVKVIQKDESALRNLKALYAQLQRDYDAVIHRKVKHNNTLCVETASRYFDEALKVSVDTIPYWDFIVHSLEILTSKCHAQTIGESDDL